MRKILPADLHLNEFLFKKINLKVLNFPKPNLFYILSHLQLLRSYPSKNGLLGKEEPILTVSK